MLKFLCFLLAGLILMTGLSRAETYSVPKDMTASQVAKDLGISFKDLKEANPKEIKTAGTKLKKGTKLNIPTGQNYYNQKYLVKTGGLFITDADIQGFLINTHMEYDYSLNKKTNDGWTFGAYGNFAGGGLWLKDGRYQEPEIAWETGARIRLKSHGVYYDLLLGYGQINLFAQLATGFEKKLFSDYFFGHLEFHPYSQRLTGQTEWFTDANLYLEGRFFRQWDKFFWHQQPINLDLLPQIATLGAEAVVVDWQLSKQFLLPIGLIGSINQYDWQNVKFFTQSGIFIEPFYDQRQIGRLYLKYQSGISGINFGRLIIGLDFDYGFILNRNEPK